VWWFGFLLEALRQAQGERRDRFGGWLYSPRPFDRLRTNGGVGVCGFVWFLSRTGCPPTWDLAGNLLRVRHRPVPGFAAGRDACGRAWGQEAPARPGESRWRLGPGFGWEVGWCGGLVFCSRPFYRLRAYMVSSHCASNFVDVLSGLLSYIRPVLEVQPLALMIMRAYCPLRTVGL